MKRDGLSEWTAIIQCHRLSKDFQAGSSFSHSHTHTDGSVLS